MHRSRYWLNSCIGGQTNTKYSFLCTFSAGLFSLQCFDAVGWAAGRASSLEKSEWWGAGMVICLKRGADLHIAQLMPLPLTVSCFSKIQIGFTFLVPAHLGIPRQRAVKRVCWCWPVLRIGMYSSSESNVHRQLKSGIGF